MRFSNDTYCIKVSSTIKDAMESIDKNLTGAALVVDEEKHVKGIITDGIIRRAILKGHEIEDSIEGIYSSEFKSVNKLMSKKKLRN